MCPENAIVFVAEDDETAQEWIEVALRIGGHRLARLATDRESALSSAEELVGLGVQVVVSDGNLSENEHSGKDGRDFIRAVRQHAPDVKIVGFSSGVVEGADINLSKTTAKFADLASAITAL